MSTLKIFISQPMSGLTNEQIIADREEARVKLEKFFEGQHTIQIIDNFQMDVEKKTLEYLGYDIACMAEADLIVFIGDYQSHRGCLVEGFVATMYGYKIVSLDNLLEKVK